MDDWVEAERTVDARRLIECVCDVLLPLVKNHISDLRMHKFEHSNLMLEGISEEIRANDDSSFYVKLWFREGYASEFVKECPIEVLGSGLLYSIVQQIDSLCEYAFDAVTSNRSVSLVYFL
jgi:hypothetical protein